MSFFTMAGSSLANLFRTPATLMYPVIDRVYPEASRGHVEIVASLCVFCGLCGKKCPTDAITVERASKTWSIERLRCIACGSCCEACPKDCLLMEARNPGPVSSDERGASLEVVKGA